MRQRDQHFVQAVLRRVGKAGGMSDDLLSEAYLESHGIGGFVKEDGPYAHAFALRKAKAKLEKHDVRAALQEFYEQAGFDVLQAADLHVKHIKGELTQQVIGPKGEVSEIKIPPSYKALADYLKLTLPQPAVKVDKRVLIGHVNAPGAPPPAISARVLSEENLDDA